MNPIKKHPPVLADDRGVFDLLSLKGWKELYSFPISFIHFGYLFFATSSGTIPLIMI